MVACLLPSPTPLYLVSLIAFEWSLFIVPKNPPPHVSVSSGLANRACTCRSAWTCVSVPTAGVCKLCWGENISKSWLSRPHPPHPKALQVMRRVGGVWWGGGWLPLKVAAGGDVDRQDSLPNMPWYHVKTLAEQEEWSFSLLLCINMWLPSTKLTRLTRENKGFFL